MRERVQELLQAAADGEIESLMKPNRELLEEIEELQGAVAKMEALEEELGAALPGLERKTTTYLPLLAALKAELKT